MDGRYGAWIGSASSCVVRGTRAAVVRPYYLPVMSPRRRLVGTSVLLVLEATGLALLASESVTGAIVAVAVTCVSWWLHLILHECGHLVAARLLGLPVVAVRIAPFTGWRNAVSIRPAPQATALPLRMALFYLGGPMTNLCTAVLLGAAAALPSTATARIALLGAGLAAALLGVANLVPGSSPGSDGRSLLRWIFTPTATRAALRLGQYWAEVSRAIAAAGVDDRPGDALPDGEDAQRALAAYRRRWSAGHVHSPAALLADAERLAALAQAEGTDPATAAAIGQVLSIQFGLCYLYAAVVDRSPVDHCEVREIAELAQLALHAQPDELSARTAMSLAHLLNQQPEQARSLLLDIRTDTGPPELYSLARLLRATAEYYLGHRGRADELAAAAGGHYPQLAQLVATIQAADPLPPLFAPGTDGNHLTGAAHQQIRAEPALREPMGRLGSARE